MARRLRSSAEIIFERENEVARRFLEYMKHLSPPTETDALSSQIALPPDVRMPDFSAALMLVAYAVENLLKGMLLAKGIVTFDKQTLPKELNKHNLKSLHLQATPKATMKAWLLLTLTEMSVWQGRYPLPTHIEKFWPTDDGSWHVVGFRWFTDEAECWIYFSDLETELRELIAAAAPFAAPIG